MTTLALDTLRARLEARRAVRCCGWHTPCWLWTSTEGEIRIDEYGSVSVDGKKLLVHRLAWELYRGPIPDGHVVDHLCRIHACHNPEHLEPVSVFENNIRGESPWARVMREGTCPAGHVYDDANTAWEQRADGTRRRHCRACNAAVQRAKRAARESSRYTREQRDAISRVQVAAWTRRRLRGAA